MRLFIRGFLIADVCEGWCLEGEGRKKGRKRGVGERVRWGGRGGE